MIIKIKTSKGEVKAELNNSESSNKIYDSLPIKGFANLWGDEIYFDIPVRMNLEDKNAEQEMNVGDLAYWPPGNAFCIFFGRTPVSINEKPRAASKVTFLGRIVDLKDVEIFKRVRDGEEIILEK